MIASPERDVAISKLLTMVQDLSGNIFGEYSSNKPFIQQSAYRWFFSSRQKADFEAWCEAAGFDPDYVREKASKIVENGLARSRCESGKGKHYEQRKQFRLRMKQKAMR